MITKQFTLQSSESIAELMTELPALYCTVIGLTRERFVVLGLPSWTHLRTRYWGVFTLHGLKNLLSAFGLWYCESLGIGEKEKVKPDSTAQNCSCKCCWNRRDVNLFRVVREIKASRENRGELLGDQVMKTASHRNCRLKWLWNL